MKCKRCDKRPAVGFATGLCERCLYEDEMPPAAVERQVLIPEADRKRERDEARARRKASNG